jgi:magnesium/cobalt transport protein CorA
LLHRYLITYGTETPGKEGDDSSKSGAKQAELQKLVAAPSEIPENSILWVDAESPTDEEMHLLEERFKLQDLGELRKKIDIFGDDAKNVGAPQLHPGLDIRPEYVFCTLIIPTLKKGEMRNKASEDDDNSGDIPRKLVFRNLNLFVFFSERWLVTLHRDNEQVIQEIDTRVKVRGVGQSYFGAKSRPSAPTADYLFYLFLDAALDSSNPILDTLEDRIEDFDRKAVTFYEQKKKNLRDVGNTISSVGRVRFQLMILRRILAPTRNMVSMMMRGEVPFVSDNSLRNFRDIYDRTFQLIETIDSFRDRTSDVRDLYISLLAASTDSIVRYLTVVATIFLPLSLLAGIYGTNFTAGFFEPGSGSPSGFYLFTGFSTFIAILLFLIFKRRGWI